MTGASHTIHIPGWHPTPLNKLLGAHHMKAHRLKLTDAEMIWAYSTAVPKAAGRRSVEITITLAKGQRAVDPDSPLKSTLDALVKLRLLVNDSRQWLDLEPVKFKRAAEMATTIKLTELP